MSREQERENRFAEFLKWFKANIKGKERAEGQIFFDRLFQSFGNAGVFEVGAQLEDPVKKKTGKTGFADLVWKPRVIIELKKRGENLKNHYHQAEEYWIRLVPDRPQYMILCNFDEFWIYDLNKQLNDPVHILKIENLEKEYTALAFLFPIQEPPFFNNNNVAVTEEAARILGEMYLSLQNRKIDSVKAQRFVLQLVVALFSEDVGLIPKHTLQKVLKEAIQNSVTQKELFELFSAMATEEKSKKSKKYSSIPYFNGGIFNSVESFELKFNELHLLAKASEQDWSKVRPSVFGAIFESSMDQDARHGHGIHYTSELDIHKIVGPTIIRPFRQRIEKAGKNKKELIKILEEIRNFKVLDPACGSGNFLYIAFRELRRLEIDILERTEKNFNTKQMRFGLISPKNFFGIDTNEFGLELAKVALCIGRKLSADEFGIADNILPFDNLDENFSNEDALFAAWPEADAIIGNPPFLGMRHFRENVGDDYADKVLAKFADVKGRVDYCVYWFRKAQESSANFIGLVGTNTISQGESRKAGLDYIIRMGGTIVDAISSQEWSGDAVVHVSIVNWQKYPVDTVYLDGKRVDSINSSLKTGKAITDAKTLSKNKGKSFQGCLLLGKDFVITEAQVKAWVKEDSKNKLVLKNYVDGTSFLDPNAKFGWVIDFENRPIELARSFRAPFEHVKKYIKPIREKNKDKQRREKWWCYARSNSDLREAISKIERYFALTQQHKYTIFRPLSSKILPCEAVMVVASDDFYILGVLNSKFHREWVLAQASTLKGDTRYTNTTCFETFPFLWDASEKSKKSIRDVMNRLDDYRVKTMKDKNYGVTKLYNDFFNEPASQLYKLHRELDEAVAKVYDWKFDPNKNYNEDLYNLNLKMYRAEIEEDEKKKSGNITPKSKRKAKK